MGMIGKLFSVFVFFGNWFTNTAADDNALALYDRSSGGSVCFYYYSFCWLFFFFILFSQLFAVIFDLVRLEQNIQPNDYDDEDDNVAIVVFVASSATVEVTIYFCCFRTKLF